jgi:hypothetical protein
MNRFLALVVLHPDLIAMVVLVPTAALLGSRNPSNRKRWDWFLLASLSAVPAAVACKALTIGLSRLAPLKLDQYVYCLDSAFGQPSFLIGRYLSQHSWLQMIAVCAYNALGSAMLAVFAAYLWDRTDDEVAQVARVFLLNLSVAVPIYLLLPVCGPLYAFPGFPFSFPAHLTPHAVPLLAPPNGIPSVHMSTALLVLWFARRWTAGTILAIIYSALIVLSTLGSGEHYLIDLFAAIPYAAFILWLGRFEWKGLHALRPNALTGRRRIKA